MAQAPVFLSAEWRWLLMLNYTIDPQLLAPLVPEGVELDPYEGQHYVSIVAFQFLNTRVRGFWIPFHAKFEEVNLRFYVRRTMPSGEVRRGVTFIKEIAPRAIICWAARRLYNENYVTMPMRHGHRLEQGVPRQVSYGWRHGNRWERVSAHATGSATIPPTGSHAEYITEHYWGYTRQRNGGTLEYEVQHPQWQVWETAEVEYEANVEMLYGPEFAAVLEQPPASALVADGSAVKVHTGQGVSKA